MNALQSTLHNYFPLAPDQLEKLSSFFKPRTLKKGQSFVKAGHHATEMAFVESGIFRIYSRTDKKEVTQWLSTPGYFITELSSFLFNTLSRYHIEAIEDAQIHVLSAKEYKQMSAHIEQWNEVERNFIGKCFITLEDRIFSFLSMTAEERYHAMMQFQPDLFQTVPLQYLASMLGMTPETLSRIRARAGAQ